MRFLLLSSLFLGGAFLFPSTSRGNQQPTLQLAAEDNVNSRYTVESIEVAGEARPELPLSLREKVASLIGSRFDPVQFDSLAREIRKELHLRSVKPHILRGTTPDRVRVVLDTERRSVEFDLSVPKFLYHSVQGWSAQVQASTTIARDNVIHFGLVSDGDELTERFSGFTAGYENLHTGTDRLHTSIQIEEFHESWHDSTIAADGAHEPDLYRSRRNVQPEAVFIVARPLKLIVGASFESLEKEIPMPTTSVVSSGTSGGGPASANAVLLGLDYNRSIEAGSTQRQVEFNYLLRTASKDLGSDYQYTRHRGELRYTVSFGRNTITDDALAGVINGNAPLFERFVLGTSSLLRGWNRYEIDPLGGDRVLHNSLDYSYRLNPDATSHPAYWQVFYDAGALWNQGQSAPVRESLGVGYRQSVFSLALAFPLRGGRIDPVFMVGMNY